MGPIKGCKIMGHAARRSAWIWIAAIAGLVATTGLSPSARAETDPVQMMGSAHDSAQTAGADPVPAFAELYRRADQDLSANLVAARRLAAAFEAAYVPGAVTAPITGREAHREHDDFREWISELRRAAGSHRRNAGQIGRIDDWEDKLQRWGLYNLRLSMRRLWLMHLSAAVFEAGRIETALEDPDADRAQLAADLRATLVALRAVRADLARRSWQWADFVNAEIAPVHGQSFEQMIYEAFALDLAARLADPQDPAYGRADAGASDLDWLTRNMAAPEARIRLLLAELAGTDDPARAPYDAVARFVVAEPVETYRPAAR